MSSFVSRCAAWITLSFSHLPCLMSSRSEISTTLVEVGVFFLWTSTESSSLTTNTSCASCTGARTERYIWGCHAALLGWMTWGLHLASPSTLGWKVQWDKASPSLLWRRVHWGEASPSPLGRRVQWDETSPSFLWQRVHWHLLHLLGEGFSGTKHLVHHWGGGFSSLVLLQLGDVYLLTKNITFLVSEGIQCFPQALLYHIDAPENIVKFPTFPFQLCSVLHHYFCPNWKFFWQVFAIICILLLLLCNVDIFPLLQKPGCVFPIGVALFPPHPLSFHLLDHKHLPSFPRELGAAYPVGKACSTANALWMPEMMPFIPWALCQS